MLNNSFFTVSEINAFIKRIIEKEDSLFNITVKGEISNLKQYPKAIYFTLKDGESVMSAVMFGFGMMKSSFIPRDGDEVLVYGSVQVYEKRGNYQLVANNIELYGQGLQLLKLQQLKKKLQEEGLFASARKKALPMIPKTIGIVTGKDSAAYKDLIFNINRRFPLVSIKYFPTLVQGSSAPKDIIETLRFAYTLPLDLIIIGRGGGSEEDLNAFNDEEVARTVAASPIPTISAVGHEINQSITDLVADRYVSTPTGAAELAVPDQSAIRLNLGETYGYLYELLSSLLGNYRKAVSNLAERPVLSKPSYIYEERLKDIEKIKDKLDNAFYQNFSEKKHQVEALSLKMTNPAVIINEYKTKSGYLKDNLTLNSNNYIQRLKILLDKNIEKLIALSPMKVLERGYSIVQSTDGTIITSSRQVEEKQRVLITLKSGKIVSEVKEKKDE